MIGVLSSSAVDRSFYPYSDQTKDYQLIFTASPLGIVIIKKSSESGLVCSIVCPSGATLLPVGKYNENPVKCGGLVQSRYDHHLIKCNLFSP